MTSGLAKIVDIILGIWWWFVPFFVLDCYEEGVVLRFGHLHRKASPGFSWMWPFGIEEVRYDNVKPQALDLPFQTFTLKDETTLSMSVVLVWEISDIVRFLLEIEDRETILAAAQGTIQQFTFQFNWQDILDMRAAAAEDGRRYGLEEKLRSTLNAEFSEWAGVNFVKVKLPDFTRTSFREGVHRVIGA